MQALKHPWIESEEHPLNESEEKYGVMKVPNATGWRNLTILAAPKWMFANHGDGDGWFAVRPRPGAAFHCMSHNQGIKPRMLRAYDMWHWDVLGAGRGIRVGQGRYLSLASAAFGEGMRPRRPSAADHSPCLSNTRTPYVFSLLRKKSAVR